jgi:hypothetical protein
MGGLTEITNYSTSSLQDIYNNLPFIEQTGDGKQLLQDVSLYLEIKYLTFRVGLCYPPIFYTKLISRFYMKYW